LYSALAQVAKGATQIAGASQLDEMGTMDIAKIRKGTINLIDSLSKLLAGVGFKQLIKWTVDFPKATMEKLAETDSIKELKKRAPNVRIPPVVQKQTIDKKRYIATEEEKKEYISDVYNNFEKNFNSPSVQGVYLSASADKKSEIIKNTYKLSREEATGKLKQKIYNRIVAQ
jgi:hypothetical protein